MRKKESRRSMGLMSGVLSSDMMAGVLLSFCSDHVCDYFFRSQKSYQDSLKERE